MESVIKKRSPIALALTLLQPAVKILKIYNLTLGPVVNIVSNLLERAAKCLFQAIMEESTLKITGYNATRLVNFFEEKHFWFRMPGCERMQI